MTKKVYVDGTWEGSVDFIRKLCMQALNKSKAHSLAIEYDDLFQEASCAFVDAKRVFNPDRGVKFLTYLGTAVSNRLNKIVGESIKSRMAMSTISIDDSAVESGSGEHSLHETIPDEQPLVEEVMATEETIAQRLGTLSPLARRVVELIVSPPEEVKAEFKAYQIRCSLEREKYGVRTTAPREINSRFILSHFLPSIVSMKPSDYKSLNEELKRFAEYASI